MFVDYHRVFSDIDHAAGQFAALEIAVGPSLRAVITRFQQASAAVLARERPVDPSLRDRIGRGLDMAAAHGVAALTGIDILAGL